MTRTGWITLAAFGLLVLAGVIVVLLPRLIAAALFGDWSLVWPL